MTTKHTSGPWTANDYRTDLPNHSVIYVRAGSEHVAQCWRPGCDRGLPEDERDAEQAANARLIAAAPKLLEALQQAVADVAIDEIWPSWYAKALNAIAKAEEPKP